MTLFFDPDTLALDAGGYKASELDKDLGREAYHANRRSKSVLIDIAREAA